MQITPWIAAGFIAATACFGAHAQTATAVPAKAVASIATDKMPAKVQVAGRTLVLNGSGTRYRAMFKVYDAGLYLEKPTQNFEEMVRSPEQAKRIVMVVQRDLPADELGKLFMRGIQANLDRSQTVRLMGAMLSMANLFNEYKSLGLGDEVILDWVPGTGTVLTVKGKRMKDAIPEPEFFTALSGIWLSNSPADWKLRDAMLGIKNVDTAKLNGGN